MQIFPKKCHTKQVLKKFQEHQVKDGMALKFFLDTLVTLKAEKGGSAVSAVIKKSGIESRLMDFFPPTNQQQTEENFVKTFNEKGLGEVVAFRKQHAAAESRNTVLIMIKESIEDEKTPKEIIIELKDSVAKNNITEQDALIMVMIFLKILIGNHSMMSWNPTSKKSSTETEYGVWELLSCSFTKQSQKISFRSPCEKNHKTSLSKVKSLNGRNFFNNK